MKTVGGFCRGPPRIAHYASSASGATSSTPHIPYTRISIETTLSSGKCARASRCKSISTYLSPANLGTSGAGGSAKQAPGPATSLARCAAPESAR